MSSIASFGRAALALAAALVLGCGSAAPASSTGGQPSPTGEGVDTNPNGDAPPVDHPPLDPSMRPVTSGAAQRLSVAQLRSVLPIALGKDKDGNDITWMIGSKKGLDIMNRTLGEPDWTVITAEDLTPSPLYLKLMDDAARDVCGRALDADATRSDKASRTILRFVEPTDVDTKAAPFAENLRYLKLRFHGVHLESTDTTTIAPLATLFAAAAATQTSAAPDVQARTGWNAVCVALVTAPEFHLY